MELDEYGQVVNAKDGVCPCCGSTNLDYGVFGILFESLGYFPVTCNDCHASFDETYEMNFYSQDNVDISKCNA